MRQWKLITLFELLTAIAVAIVAVRSGQLLWFVSTLVLFGVWTYRIHDLAIRWSLRIVCGGSGTICAGMACIQRAFAATPEEVHRVDLEYLAFCGTLLSTLGLFAALAGAGILALYVCFAGRSSEALGGRGSGRARLLPNR